MWKRPIFTDRRDAGRQLSAALARFRDAHPVVLALPRGGVPVAYEVALALNAPLDVVLVRKIGAPGQPELGLGAVVEGTAEPFLSDDVVAAVAPSAADLEAATARARAEIDARRDRYRAGPRVAVAGRTVIVVDDGIATGGTARAVLDALAREGPSHLVLAVPVAPPAAIAALQRATGAEIVCLSLPESFGAVGFYYERFDQTSDAEVRQLLADTAARRSAAGAPSADGAQGEDRDGETV